MRNVEPWTASQLTILHDPVGEKPRVLLRDNSWGRIRSDATRCIPIEQPNTDDLVGEAERAFEKMMNSKVHFRSVLKMNS